MLDAYLRLNTNFVKLDLTGEILPVLSGRLGSSQPRTEGSRLAAVSIMLTDASSPDTLLIRRAERPGDPWSGQVAFPGGKFQESDVSARGTAVREALEEVGIDLAGSSEFLGYSAPFRTHTGGMDVIPAVFLLKGQVKVRINEEATSYKWVNLERLTSEDARTTYTLDFGGEPREVPAFRVEDFVVWGLTHRIISSLLEPRRD